MRRTYACVLELADPAGRDPVSARAVTKRWLGAMYGGWAAEGDDQWVPEPHARVSWRIVEHLGDSAFELVWTRPHDSDPTLWRRMQVQVVTTADGDGRIVVIEGLESQDRTVRSRTPDTPSGPGLIRELVGTAHCVDGGWRVQATPHRMGEDRAIEVDAFVRGGRRLPVVMFAADGASRVSADADRAAAELVGLAHVVVLTDPASVSAVARELGTRRAVVPGGVRLLWPDWRSVDPPERHRLWRAEDVTGPDGPRPAVRNMVRALVFDAATLRIDDDPAVARIARAESAHELGERRADLARLERAVAEDRAVAHELVDEYQNELRRADDEVYRLEQAMEREHELRVRAENAYLQLATRPDDAPSRADEVRTLTEAVRLAKSRLDHLVVLPEAERSARAWHYDRADLVWADLLRLEAVAADWAADALQGDFSAEARRRGLDWARDISEDAKAKFGDEYLRRYDGHTVQLGPHIRRAGRQILRIYCYLDRAHRRVVIGHIGGHLGDRTI
ncbi:MAG: hypothetical protein JJE46_00700 [Acidimicrobiia bacterium]|nr:hypothetical protein [Acidimicrobiia bacterium]